MKHVMRRLLKGQLGFTVMETLVALSIIGVVGTATTGFLYQMRQATTKGSKYLAVEADMRTSMQWLARDFRSAQTTTLVDGGAVASCATPSPNTCVTINWTDEYGGASTNYSSSYKLVGTELLRTYGAATQVVGRHVTAMTVSRG